MNALATGRDVYGQIALHKEYYTAADRSVKEAVHSVPREKNVYFNASTPHAHQETPSRVAGPNHEHKPITATATGAKIKRGGQNMFVQEPDLMERNRKAGLEKYVPPRPVRLSERPPWQGVYGVMSNDRIGKQQLPIPGPERKASKQMELQVGQDAVLLSSLRVEAGNTKRRPGRGRRLPKPPTETPEDLPPVFQRLTNPKNFTASHKHRFMPEDEPDLEHEGVPSSQNAEWWRRKERKGKKKKNSTTSPPHHYDDDMPPVYQRLTNPKYYTSTHYHRFDPETGEGRGIDGRRDDETFQHAIQGQVKILRDDDPEMDGPSAPPASSHPVKKVEVPRPESASRSKSGRRRRRKQSSNDAYTDKCMTEGVFSRLYKPAYTDKRPEGEHDATIKVMKNFNVIKSVIPKWQSGL